MADLSPSERDHALDATRAFALLLGVAFHGAWSFVPYDFGAPAVDRSANELWGWFFFASHTFRMQLFFLIAGFFARLVVEKRGIKRFAMHRFQRIFVPFVLGWLILYPLVLVAWFWGGNLTGRNLTPLPIPLLVELMFGDGLLFVRLSEGGFFRLAHLWFLYYLLWFYCIFVFSKFVFRSDALKRFLDRWVTKTIDSVWSPLILALVTGAMLVAMKGWFGVDTPNASLVPSIPTLAVYGTFFGLGWLLHRQPLLLRVRNHRWRWQIPLGIVLSIPLYVAFARLLDNGTASRLGVEYPSLVATQIRDWPKFIEILQSASSQETGTDAKMLWDAIAVESTQLAILDLDADSSIDQQAGVCRTLTTVITTAGRFTDEGLVANEASSWLPIDVVKQNRHRLESIFGDTLTRNPRGPWYLPTKYLYSVGYALIMWLLVFGTLGAFQDRCHAQSKTWRYIADSSYWVYLVHLPVVPFIQVWMRDWPLPSFVKLALQLFMASVLLFGSYHVLVRPTWVGKLLNGRRYPILRIPENVDERPASAATGN
jgi:peptidoglycan/LPS O-acetylase OafA/YrhL